VAINAIFILAELHGAAGVRIREIQREFDPKLAAIPTLPHITVAGSSGVGPMVPTTTVDRIAEALSPIAADTPPMSLRFEPPHRFMQTNIIVLPLDPHGPLRVLHDRIATSGLTFEPARFAFTPHCTLSFYPTPDKAMLRRILSVRVEEPAVIDRIAVFHTMDPQPSRKLLELPLTGIAPRGAGKQATNG
jgi:2'-5' RNA ligase